MNERFVTDERTADFLTALCRGKTVYASVSEGDHYHLVRDEGWRPDRHVLGAFRPVEPLKAVVFRPRQSLGELFGEAAADPASGPDIVVVGVKNCDLSALAIHDHVFLAEPVDPTYARLREKTLLVASDCTGACDVCFCTAVREQPYPRRGFDINLSPVPGGCVVEEGSPRGKAALESLASQLGGALPEHLRERDRRRGELSRRVEEQAAQNGLPAASDLQRAVARTAESDLWGQFAADCVECGACNFACCTCHCFLLADGCLAGGVPGRVRQWDSCLYRDFARVAGGANPRKHRAERLYNRFDKKFNFFPQVLGRYACDGCGRCIQVCTGKIDIRQVLKKALDETKSL
ncbi:MAG: 4Fe-4S dicluster domain-containing protein [Planctomycetota bacterium]